MSVLRIEVEPPLAWVVLARPSEGNPIDDALVSAFVDAWSVLAGNVEVRAIGILAEGPVFSVGVARGLPTTGRSFGPKSCGCATPILLVLQGDIGSGAFRLLGEADAVLAASDVCLTAPNEPGARVDVSDLRPRLAEPQIRRLALLGPFEPLSAARAAELGAIDELVPYADLRERSIEMLLELAGDPPRA